MVCWRARRLLADLQQPARAANARKPPGVGGRRTEPPTPRTHSKHAAARQRGFSLLEVLVAFTVMAIALTVLLQAISAGLRNTATTQDYNQALAIAERRISVAQAQIPLQGGSRSGVERSRFQWTTQVKPVDWTGGGPSNGPYRLFRITVRVIWGQGDNSRDVRLVTMQAANKRAP